MMIFFSAKDISHNYGDVKALDNFSLELNKGEIFALVGPDGAGKTTFLRTLVRLVIPSQGEIIIDGKELAKNYESMKHEMGYMPQIFSLYPDLSVEENLIFYSGIFGITGEEYKKRRDQLYTFSNLAPFAKRRASALSGGMKQKLALSCALIHQPQLLILDEPTTGVDPLSRRPFWEILLQLKKEGVTILVSTPYMDEVARADRACFIFDGRKLAEGTPDELSAQFDGQIYFLDISPTSDLERELNSLTNISARRFGSGMHLYLNKSDSIQNFDESFGRLKIDMNNLHLIKADLEDRFIQLMEQNQ